MEVRYTYSEFGTEVETSVQVHIEVRMDVRVGRYGRRDDWRSTVPLPEKEIPSFIL